MPNSADDELPHRQNPSPGVHINLGQSNIVLLTVTTEKRDPWLGHIPKHWEIKPLKTFFGFGKGSNAQELTAEYIADHPGEYPVYSGQTENDGVMGRISSYAYDVPKVIFTTTVGARVMTPLVFKGRFSLSQNCLIMRPRNGRVCVRYVFYQLHPLFAYERAAIPSYMQPSLRMSDLNHYSVACPPTDEQQGIAEYLDGETAKLDALLAKVRTAIERLREYRTALISAAVTGQIDVRSGR
ncbi:MAG: restriction endonuclease subunit S [Verrucomicrobia bacterium]|nr:restriction endonuclease subunit S [Verrucomicrobiota bacterium]